MAGSDACDGVSLAQGVLAAGEEDAEPVVVEVPEPSSGAFDLLDEEVGGLDGPVGGAGAVVGKDLGPPAPQRLGQSGQAEISRSRSGDPLELDPALGVVVGPNHVGGRMALLGVRAVQLASRC